MNAYEDDHFSYIQNKRHHHGSEDHRSGFSPGNFGKGQAFTSMPSSTANLVSKTTKIEFKVSKETTDIYCK